MNSGGKLKTSIIEAWQAEEKIELDFKGVDIFASPFFNASIGALLKDKDIKALQQKLVFEGISDHGKRLLNLVIGNALKFYSDTSGNTGLGLDAAQKDD
ncbi:STAS-like domain-containing protein [Pseudomonas syringae]|nr:STAS-like domain-containing protein [Pseudomonas syringae]